MVRLCGQKRTPRKRGARRRLPTVLKNAEARGLLEAASVGCPTGLRNRALLEAMLGAGLRVGEAVGLLPRDVDLAKGALRVTLGKGGRDRVVPVTAQTAGWLAAWGERRAALGASRRSPFFCGVKDPASGISARYVQKMVKRLAGKAGIERRVTPHTLRHTYATRMLRAGLDVREVQELLGHADVGTTQIYCHVDPARLAERVREAGNEGGPAGPATGRIARALSGLEPRARMALAGALLEGVGGAEEKGGAAMVAEPVSRDEDA